MASPARKFDVVAYGVTGFTGNLVAEYLSGVSSVKWAIAGRSEGKLKPVAEKYSVPYVLADASKPDLLDAMCKQAKVVLSTVGPFTLYGEPLIASCAKNGTHYVDITGETGFVRDMIERYEEEAVKNKCWIVSLCGFDSVPSDIGTLLVVDHAKNKLGTTVKSVSSSVKIAGAPSGGTLASMMTIVSSSKELKRMGNTTLLNYPKVVDDPVVATRDRLGPWYESSMGAWTVPFVMAGANTRVVRRSAYLAHRAGAPYGKGSFAYSESQYAGSGLIMGALRAAFAFAVYYALILSLVIPCTRACVKRFGPKPGTGPSAEQRARSRFEMTLVGLTDESPSRRVFATVSGGDPGYTETSKMVSEAAITLALRTPEEAGKFRYGFGTPASTLGMPYVARLRAAGLNLTSRH